MIVWGCCTDDLDRAAQHLLPGLQRNRRHGDIVTIASDVQIATAYNRILDAAPDGATVVLLHDDTELLDGARDGILAGLKDADLVGPVGAADITSIAWWDGEHHGHVNTPIGPLDAPHGPVDVLDGLLLAFSPHVRLRFDEGYGGFHGYDADICTQARASGLTVATADIPVFHHTRGGFGDREAWDAADARWRDKWQEALDG